jgi:hypothetical protein
LPVANVPAGCAFAHVETCRQQVETWR